MTRRTSVLSDHVAGRQGHEGKPSRLHAGANSEEHVVPADALLVAGTCIVEEAVLTGESTPQWKNPIGTPSDDTELDVSAGYTLRFASHPGLKLLL